MRIGIIGGGFMGEAFLRGMLRAEVGAPTEIAVAEPLESRRTALSEHGVRVTDDAESACIGAELVLLAVKPDVLPEVAERLSGAIPSGPCSSRSRRARSSPTSSATPGTGRPCA